MRTTYAALIVSFCFLSCANAQTKSENWISHANYADVHNKVFTSGRAIASNRAFKPVSRAEVLAKTYISADGDAKLEIRADGSWSVNDGALKKKFGTAALSGNNLEVLNFPNEGYNAIRFAPKFNGRELQAFVALLSPEEGEKFRENTGAKKTPKIWVGLIYGSPADGEATHLMYFE